MNSSRLKWMYSPLIRKSNSVESMSVMSCLLSSSSRFSLRKVLTSAFSVVGVEFDGIENGLSGTAYLWAKMVFK